MTYWAVFATKNGRSPKIWIYVWEWANVEMLCVVPCFLAILASPPHHPSAPSPLRIVWDEKQPFSSDQCLWSGWNCLKTILKTSSLTRIFQSVPFQLPAEADKTRHTWPQALPMQKKISNQFFCISYTRDTPWCQPVVTEPQTLGERALLSFLLVFWAWLPA